MYRYKFYLLRDGITTIQKVESLGEFDLVILYFNTEKPLRHTDYLYIYTVPGEFDKEILTTRMSDYLPVGCIPQIKEWGEGNTGLKEKE